MWNHDSSRVGATVSDDYILKAVLHRNRSLCDLAPADLECKYEQYTCYLL